MSRLIPRRRPAAPPSGPTPLWDLDCMSTNGCMHVPSGLVMVRGEVLPMCAEHLRAVHELNPFADWAYIMDVIIAIKVD